MRALLTIAILLLFSCLAYAEPEAQKTTTEAVPAIPDSTATQPADTIHWVPLEEGIRASQESGKPVFLFCYGSWCGYSQKMLARTFHDTAVIQYLNSYFTPVMIETQSKRQTLFHDSTMTEARVANVEFGVKAVPCMWLVEPDGCRIKKVKGYYPAKYLLPELQAVHEHVYGDCQNAPLTDPPPPPKPDSLSQSGK